MHLHEQETKQVVKQNTYNKVQVCAVAFPGLLDTSEDTSSEWCPCWWG